ncbi:hypothetical protein Rt10032_c01g0495 [Rhodotorula toruloides]|uniref:Uncharacterized protein n=1 Tax=Rhodotorula toruloides TaxID=5286 RepID=A0A511K800_RHOTO|nr:hypothetical protein Rt10032_c01g0495 [Rhodotorula toruloides]
MVAVYSGAPLFSSSKLRDVNNLVASSTLAEPTYVHTNSAATLLSEARPTRLSPAALSSLNYISDELLYLIVHAALHSAPIETAPNVDAQTVANAPVPLGADEVLTTERFKSALARILGPTSLAKECILEADLAVRELVRRASPSLRADGALKKTSGRGVWGSPVLPETASLPGAAAGETNDSSRESREKVAKQAVEVFRCLRAWVTQISGVGGAAPLSGAPSSLTEHLVALSPPKPPPASAQSPHISFLLALYVERILTHLSTHILRLVASSASSRPSSDADVTATVTDLEAALMQDQLVWNWVQGMRVRAYIEQEGKSERARSRNGGMGRRKSTNSSMVASPVSTNAGGVVLPDVGTPERRPSPASSTAVPSTIDTRRSSFASTVVGLSNGVKQGTGLDIGTKAKGVVKAAASGDDSFDQLLNSGKTIKLSSTPDRLRFENKRMSGSRSTSALANSTDSPSRHLRARPPQFGGVLSESYKIGQRIDDRDRPSGSRKDSLIDLLNSPPPWSNDDATPSRRQSIVPKRPVPQDDPLHPVRIAMRVQGSQQSVSTVDSAASDGVDGDDALASPGAATRALRAKDERRDLASERQINNDLMAFFAAEPPSLPRPMSTVDPRPSFDDFPSKDKSDASKASRGGLRGLVSRVTGGASGSGRKNDSAGPASPTSPPPHSPPPPSYRSQAGSPPRRASRMQSIDGSEGSSSNTQTAFRVAGFSDSIARAATKYTPPPGLGSPPARDAGQPRRSLSVPAVDQPPNPPYSSPPLPASTQTRRDRSSRIPQNGASSAKASASEDGHASRFIPPIPVVDAAPVVTPPRRSSSLKRSRRERETSGASSSTVSTTRAFPAIETSAPPVTVEPITSTASTPGAAAPSAPTSSVSKSAAADVAAAAAIAPVVATGATHVLRHDSRTQPSTISPPPLTPVVEAASSPVTLSIALTPSTSCPTPARPTSSSGLSGKTLVSHLRELRSAMLAYAHSKEDCVELVEAMLRDEAKRVEKLAQREREETLAKERGREVNGVQKSAATFVAADPSGSAQMLEAGAAARWSGGPGCDRDKAPDEMEDAETHQARLAEYLLTGDGQSSEMDVAKAATSGDESVGDISAQAERPFEPHSSSAAPAASSALTQASQSVLRLAEVEATA